MIFLIFLFFLNKNNISFLTDTSKFYFTDNNQNKKTSNGYDMRYNDTNNSISYFSNIFLKKKLLDNLLNKNMSIYHKIILLDEYDKNNFGLKYNPNIQNGGLMDDWNHNFQ